MGNFYILRNFIFNIFEWYHCEHLYTTEV